VRLVLASWNVHGWVGSDARREPSRCFEAIRDLDADAVALQEVEGSDWEALARAAGYRAVLGHTGPLYGNALLVRAPLASVCRLDLSVPRREPRGALDAVIELPGGPLRVIATHLGLRAPERRRQAARLARHIEARDEGIPTALLGDLNDWTPWGRQLRPLARCVGPLSRIPTFPSQRPFFALDRAAWRIPGLEGATLAAVRSAAVRGASDHLALRLDLRVGSGDRPSLPL